jgi:hypothetical protein
MSISAPSSAPGFVTKAVSDTLSRTVPPEFIQKPGTPMYPPLVRLDSDIENLEREAFVCTRPLSSVAVSMAPKLAQKPTPQASPVMRELHPPMVCYTSQRATTTTSTPTITTTTTSTAVERLSPRPYTSSRSPLVPLRASPPPTPSPDTYRDVMLAARSQTILTPVQMSITSS